MRILCTLVAALAVSIAASAQDYIESFTHNKDYRDASRAMQYYPDGNGGLTCHNGKNLYTRALYGSNTLWRLETSDMPIFAAYHKRDNRNIRFCVRIGSVDKYLDLAADCTANYRGGLRTYRISDPAWGSGYIVLTAVADPDSEGALWKAEAHGMPATATLTCMTCATVNVKLNRSGDMGADPANCFAPDPDMRDLKQCTADIGGSATVYFRYADRDVSCSPRRDIERDYEKALKHSEDLCNHVVIKTPDEYINTLSTTLCAAADGIWDGQTYQHGAVGWRIPLSGWRGAYTGDFLGRHDRARTHFDAYATSQVTDVPPAIPHPTPDYNMGLARAEKRWGTQMYSNGYICRNPGRNDQMHHYDMNLCYIDELLWHLQWTGDKRYARAVWPVIERSLAWEKRNYDPDDDALYDAYCCIWASDALYYNSGAVTHSSAYNYRANRLAARIAESIGKDPEPYKREADRILAAMDSVLWMPDRGVWAEFRDFMGGQRLHTHPALWTVYHAIDSETATDEQAYRATRYIDENIPHIAVSGEGCPEGDYATLSTTDWLPYAWSINNVAFAEVYHTVLAYYLAGRPDEATRLLKSAMLDGMFLGNSPGNVGQVSHYDAARGESYRDFADPIGVLSRAVVQGLFGFSPNMLYGRVNMRPGFPSDWDHASISHPDFKLDYTADTAVHREMRVVENVEVDEQVQRIDRYRLHVHMTNGNHPESLHYTLPARYERAIVISEGREVPARRLNQDTPYETISFDLPVESRLPKSVTVVWLGGMCNAAHLPSAKSNDIPSPLGLDLAMASKGNDYRPVNLTMSYNANVDDIFRNKYLAPRSPYTTLQIPEQGIGEWCHPKDTAYICDDALRNLGGLYLTTPQGIPFRLPQTGHNAVYVSLFDNYPDSVSIPLDGRAHAVNLLMAGSTNHMQAYMENATVHVTYTDGSAQTLSLVPPYNWAPIEQDYFVDGKAFSVPTPAPQRLALKSGIVSNNLGRDLGINGVYGRRIEGGAGILLCLPLDPDRELASMTLRAHSNDVVIGLIAATLVVSKEK